MIYNGHDSYHAIHGQIIHAITCVPEEVHKNMIHSVHLLTASRKNKKRSCWFIAPKSATTQIYPPHGPFVLSVLNIYIIHVHGNIYSR